MSRQQENLRVLVLSDHVHESLYSPAIRERFSGVDAVISCGDLPFPYLEYILTLLNVPLLYVPGNHDRPMQTADGRTIHAPEGATNIDGRLVTLRFPGCEPVTVAGLGGSMWYGGGAYQYTEREMSKRARALEARLLWNRWLGRGGLDVFVTHAPPDGIHAGQDLCHRGFRAFLGFIRRTEPRYHFHGHVHPSYGYDTDPRQYHRTEVRNVYGYEVVEIPA